MKIIVQQRKNPGITIAHVSRGDLTSGFADFARRSAQDVAQDAGRSDADQHGRQRLLGDLVARLVDG